MLRTLPRERPRRLSKFQQKGELHTMKMVEGDKEIFVPLAHAEYYQKVDDRVVQSTALLKDVSSRCDFEARVCLFKFIYSANIYTYTSYKWLLREL